MNVIYIKKLVQQFFCRHRWYYRLTIDNKYHDVRMCTKCKKHETLWSGTMLEWRERHE